MTNRRMLSVSILAAGILALCLPVLAAAQGSYDPWGRNQDDRRDRDYRRDRNDDRYGRYDDRYLRDSIQRLDRLAKDFERDLDRDLDRSREDGTGHEDRVNNEARDFRNAVGNLKSRFGNGRDLNRSTNEAQQVLREANRTERVARHHFDNSRLASEWSQIQQELNVIADAYGVGYGGNNNGGYYPNNGRNDDYRRNDRNRRTNNNNNDWWRRLPFPTTWP
ncbi:MAG: hypothetical protein M3R52_12680 [Acidobacteriota bacterium]|nr:hypothetical protein [Acidobacteriota bacterium]